MAQPNNFLDLLKQRDANISDFYDIWKAVEARSMSRVSQLLGLGFNINCSRAGYHSYESPLSAR